MAIEYEETPQPVRGRIEYEEEPAAPKREKGIMDRVKDVGTSAAIGGAAGFFTPQIAMGTGQIMEKIPYKPVQMAGRAMQAAVPSLTGLKQQSIGAATGAFSGATGETAGQVAELAGAPAPIAESARILGSLAPIEILSSGTHRKSSMTL